MVKVEKLLHLLGYYYEMQKFCRKKSIKIIWIHLSIKMNKVYIPEKRHC